MSARFYNLLKFFIDFFVKNLQLKKESKAKTLPNFLIISIFVICILPSFLGWFGLDFGSTQLIPDFESLSQPTSFQQAEILYHSLRGSFVHTLLEWSAFCTALFTALLSLAHFSIRPTDAATPVMGLALFFSGCMDAFHILAANHLIEAVADNNNFVAFTWTLCRFFNIIITILGVSFFLVAKPTKSLKKNAITVLGLSLFLGLLAYLTIKIYANSHYLPDTIFPDAIIPRPFDVAPLILFIIAGTFLYPRFYHKYPSLFSHALMLSTIPDIAVQLHMAFGSTALYDHHFNIAHFLKIIAYLVPLIGLILDYIYTHYALEESNKFLSLEILERQQTEVALRVSQHQITQKTQQLEQTLAELRQTQTQLIQTEKMSSLGQLVAGIAHEINNPVNFIYGNLVHVQAAVEDLLSVIHLYQKKHPQSDRDIQDKIEDIDLDFITEDTPRMLRSMQEGSRRIRVIVESLRNFSRLDEATLKSVQLKEGIESTLLILNQKLHSINVIKNYEDLPLIECYPAELNQVWMHILANAIDSFSCNDNNFRIESDKNHSQPTIWIETKWAASHQVNVIIKDNGCGITQENLLHIFDPFFTTKDVGKGTGLGLSVCYSIIKHHGGNIQINSTINQGTEVSITLPDCVTNCAEKSII